MFADIKATPERTHYIELVILKYYGSIIGSDNRYSHKSLIYQLTKKIERVNTIDQQYWFYP